MIELFHGSYMKVDHPEALKGRAKVDFGRGFYLTKLRLQAESWAQTIAGRRPDGVAWLNVFKFDDIKAKAALGARYKIFPEYDLEWLEYVVDCRNGGEMQCRYAVVEGGVANDNVIDTVEDYEMGIITADQALGQLRYKKVNHQLAILDQIIIDGCLEFVEAKEVQEVYYA